MQRSGYMYVEKCCKIAFDNLHILSCHLIKKKRIKYSTSYDGIRQYLDILIIHNDELNEAKNVIDKIIILINEDDSDNKKYPNLVNLN